MKIALINSMGFHTAVASLVTQLKEKGIEVIVLNQIEKEERRIEEEITIISSHLKESIKAIEISSFDSFVLIDEPINKRNHEKAFHTINTRPIIRRKSFIQRRHVPTNRDK